ncbi:MAG: hypothetical protein IKU86_00300 [Thermoguttaceae bacterium]|nr:hypothetical protein [Thermoguttaceae bacterium]
MRIVENDAELAETVVRDYFAFVADMTEFWGETPRRPKKIAYSPASRRARLLRAASQTRRNEIVVVGPRTWKQAENKTDWRRDLYGESLDAIRYWINEATRDALRWRERTED